MLINENIIVVADLATLQVEKWSTTCTPTRKLILLNAIILTPSCAKNYTFCIV